MLESEVEAGDRLIVLALQQYCEQLLRRAAVCGSREMHQRHCRWPAADLFVVARYQLKDSHKYDRCTDLVVACHDNTVYCERILGLHRRQLEDAPYDRWYILQRQCRYKRKRRMCPPRPWSPADPQLMWWIERQFHWMSSP